MLGQWKNFDELESNLSIAELMALLDASRNKTLQERKFVAAINGIELEGDASESDVIDLKGVSATNEGFGIDHGLGFIQMGDDEWQE